MKPKTNHEVIDKIYKEKFEKFLYYCWIQKSIRTNFKGPRPKKPRYQITWVNCTYQFILIACTSTSDINLMWKNFSSFWDLISKDDELTSYAIEFYLDLIDFLWSWVDYKKDKCIRLLGKERIGLTCYMLGPRRFGGT
jgi:hypothetical protein